MSLQLNGKRESITLYEIGTQVYFLAGDTRIAVSGVIASNLIQIRHGLAYSYCYIVHLDQGTYLQGFPEIFIRDIPVNTEYLHCLNHEDEYDPESWVDEHII